MKTHIKHLSWIPAKNGIALHPLLIGLRKDIKGKRKEKTVAEEVVHLHQQKDHGWWCFILRWLFSKGWRSEYELEGAAAQIRKSEDNMKKTLLDFYAKSRSGNYASPPAPFGAAEPEIIRRGMLTGYVNNSRARPKGNPAFWYIGLLTFLGLITSILPAVGVAMIVATFILEWAAIKTEIPEYE